MAVGRRGQAARYWMRHGGPDDTAVAAYRISGAAFEVFDGDAGEWRPGTPAEFEATRPHFDNGVLREVPGSIAALATMIIWGTAHNLRAEPLTVDVTAVDLHPALGD